MYDETGIDYGEILEETRRVLRQRRGWFRKVHAEDRLQGRQFAGDPLDLQWDENQQLLKNGRVVWAALIQANTLLFELSVLDAPGEVLSSLDPYFDDRPEELLEVARAAGRLKGTKPEHPGLRMIADDITNEMSRTHGKPVPPELSANLTEGSGICRHSLVFQRYHMPERILTNGIFPILTHPSCKTVTFLPGNCWGIKMRAHWKLSDAERRRLQMEKQERDAPRRQWPVVRLTETAMQKLRDYGSHQGRSKLFVRVGLSEDLRDYNFSFIEAPEISRSDHVLHQEDVVIAVSARDAELIWGILLDFDPSQTEGFRFLPFEDQVHPS